MRLVLYRHGRNTQPFGERESNVLFSTVEIPNGQTTVLAKGITDFPYQKLRRRGTGRHPDTLLTGKPLGFNHAGVVDQVGAGTAPLCQFTQAIGI